LRRLVPLSIIFTIILICNLSILGYKQQTLLFVKADGSYHKIYAKKKSISNRAIVTPTTNKTGVDRYVRNLKITNIDDNSPIINTSKKANNNNNNNKKSESDDDGGVGNGGGNNSNHSNYIIPYVGVDMQGYYTSIAQTRNFSSFSYLPSNYYEDLFRLISQVGMNHVRYVFYWESYVRNPVQFISELSTVAKTADKYGIKVIYANHQFHTSSWLDENSGIGFPSFLFKNEPLVYKYNSGGSPKSKVASTWWRNWLDRKITDSDDRSDAWSLQLSFLKNIVNTVDKHASTLGYEVLGESQIHKVDEWDKLRQYNKFMSDALTKITSKVIVFSMSTPVDIKDPKIGVTPENIAKTIPSTTAVNTAAYSINNNNGGSSSNNNINNNIRHNFVFKFDVYDLPKPNSLEGRRLEIFAKVGQIAKVPIYAGEWNIVARIKNGNHFSLDPKHSDINQTEADYLVHKLQDMRVWGMGYWRLNFEPNKIPTYNLINVSATTATTATANIADRLHVNNSSGSSTTNTDTANTAIRIQPTKYFDILKNTVPKVRAKIP
jgi:hypothetical protein